MFPCYVFVLLRWHIHYTERELRLPWDKRESGSRADGEKWGVVNPCLVTMWDVHMKAPPPRWHFFSSSVSVVRGCIIFMSNGNVWFHVLTRLHNFRTESLIFSQKRKTLERWMGEKNTRTETSSYFLFKFNTYGLWRTLWLFSLDLEGRYKWTVINSSNAFAH